MSTEFSDYINNWLLGDKILYQCEEGLSIKQYFEEHNIVCRVYPGDRKMILEFE
jgi:hypothetical protein